jgi:protein CpxP
MRTIGTTVRNTVGALALLTMIPVSGWAFGGPGGPGGGGGFQGPPKEAFDACAGKKAGEAVRFITPRGDNVAAVCREFDGKLAAQPEWGRGPGRGGRGKGMGMAKELNLTADQKTKIQGILDAERESSAALRKQLHDNRDQLRKIAEKTPFDEAAVRNLAYAQEKTHVDLIVSKARAMNGVHALLTPEQKEKAEKMGFHGKAPGMRHSLGRGYGPGSPDCPWR